MASSNRHINFALMRQRILADQAAEPDGKKYWRSLDELADTAEFREFVQREFPQQAEEWDSPVERRTFLKLMGASLALAGLSGCSYQPPEKIVPYVIQPEEIVPGKPLFYATAMELGGVATGLLARSHEGRPTKLEGNPDHPGSRGTTDVFAQASLLDLYDPDRSQTLTFREEIRPWSGFLDDIKRALDAARARQGAGLRFLTETITSPTLAAQLRDIFREMPQARLHQYEPAGRDGARGGAMLAFGQPVNTIYRFDQADRVFSIDSDFLACGPGSLIYARDFIARRKVEGERRDMNRLYAIETTLTNTGAKADHRLALRPSEMEGFVRAVAAALGVNLGAGGQGSGAGQYDWWVAALARDLQQSRGRSIIIPGDEQPAVIHALAHAMNDALGNTGKTVIHTDPLEAFPEDQMQSLRTLVADMNAGQVETLIILGGNPVYNAPVDLNFGESLNKVVGLRVHLSVNRDETSELCHWHIPQAHYLESWGDTRGHDGTATIIQPLIAPLYGGRTANELLAVFSTETNRTGYDILRSYWQGQMKGVGVAVGGNQATTATTAGQTGSATSAATQNTNTGATAGSTGTAANTAANNQTSNASGAGGAGATAPAAGAGTATLAAAPADFEKLWRKAVHDGVIPNTALPAKTVSLKADWANQLAAPAQPASANADELEIVFRTDPTIYDGRFANNGWLQELPKPLTKITWDNVLILSPTTANRFALKNNIGVEGGDVLVSTANLNYQGRSLAAVPVWVMPGQPDGVATVHLGYGRRLAGRVGNGRGFNAYAIRTSDSPWAGGGVRLTNTGDHYALAATQLHFSMENRDVVRESTLKKYLEESAAHAGEEVEHKPGQDASMYPPYDYSQEAAWGMAIDTTSCVGCNACVIACQSENNIPVVGQDQVKRSREMHWLRIDTYFKGTPDHLEGTEFMPLPCMHCENAPCEPVCPVHATVHDAEGLNVMVYNRCVGTRYCSNNCPYKVRHFNFFLYQDFNTPTYQLMRNPEVTVRSRGVMEKCTYCVQRIQAGKIESEKEGRPIADGEVKTACQAVCPTEAIVFGNTNDPASRVAQLKRSNRNYGLLADLNTQPRTTYLSSLRNPNEEITGKA